MDELYLAKGAFVELGKQRTFQFDLLLVEFAQCVCVPFHGAAPINLRPKWGGCLLVLTQTKVRLQPVLLG